MPPQNTINRVLGTVASIIKVFLVLTVLASFGVQASNSNHLPIPLADKILALSLPLFQLINTIQLTCGCYPSNVLTQDSHSASKRPKQLWNNIAFSLYWLISLLDTVLISTASSALDPETLDCNLDRTWRHWFEQKDSRPIRSIQDRFECCGLRGLRDKAWPFPDKTHGVDACMKMHDRTSTCEGAWQQSTRGVLIMFITIGVISLALKVLAAFIFSGARGEAWRSQFSARARRNDPARQALLGSEDNVDAPLFGSNDALAPSAQRND